MLLRLCLMACLMAPMAAFAKQAPPSPPEANPHPPTTAEEKTRVAFAHQQIDTYLKVESAAAPASAKAIVEQSGTISELRHLHMVPATTSRKKDDMLAPLAADEFAAHAYVTFSKAYGWHDLSVVLSVVDGKLVFRRFISAHMQSTHKLPPGAKC